MRRPLVLHVLFALALAALVALGAHWTRFFGRSVELERSRALDTLGHEAELAAARLGAADARPRLGPLSEVPGLEVVRRSDTRAGDLSAPLAPAHPELSARPVADRLDGAERRTARRRLMVAGEGSLLLVLVAVLTAMLYRLVIQERRELRRMEAFVSTVTHELKTPLAGVKSLLQTLAAGRAPPGELPGLVALGLEETERLERGIDNVLISGAIRADRYETSIGPRPLGPLLEGFVARRRRTLSAGPDLLELEDRTEGEEALADERALLVALDNLVDNALRYGEGRPVTVRALRRGPRLEVEVEDRGIGFEPGEAERLFAPFHRGHGARREAGRGGTGLGLTIARALARRMGGELTARSEGPGRGARFVLSLPAAEGGER